MSGLEQVAFVDCTRDLPSPKSTLGLSCPLGTALEVQGKEQQRASFTPRPRCPLYRISWPGLIIEASWGQGAFTGLWAFSRRPVGSSSLTASLFPVGRNWMSAPLGTEKGQHSWERSSCRWHLQRTTVWTSWEAPRALWISTENTANRRASLLRVQQWGHMWTQPLQSWSDYSLSSNEVG